MNKTKKTAIYLSVTAVVCAVILIVMEILAWSGFTIRYEIEFGYTAGDKFVYTEKSLGGYIYGNNQQYLSFGGTGEEVRAFADIGYRFSHWKEDGNSSNIRTDDIWFSKTYTAVFEYDYNTIPYLCISAEGEITEQKQSASLTIYDGDLLSAKSVSIQATDLDCNKISYELSFETTESLCDLGSSATWHLYSGYQDPAYLREGLTREIAKLLNLPYVAEVLPVNIMINDEYAGLYLLSQGIDETDTSLMENCIADYYTEGFTIDGTPYGIPTQYFNLPNGGNADELKDSIERAYAALVSGNQKEAAEALDLDSAVGMYLLEEIAKNPHVGTKEFYLTVQNGKLTFTCPSNFSLAYGADISNIRDISNIPLYYWDTITMGTSYWATNAQYLFVLLWKNEWFQTMVKERWQQLAQQERFLALSTELAAYASDNAVDFDRNELLYSLLGEGKQLDSLKHYYPPLVQYPTTVSQITWLSDWLGGRILTLNSYWEENG